MTDLTREQIVLGPGAPYERASLTDRMVRLADHDGLPVDHLMRIRAAELEARLDCEAPGWTAKNMIGAWSRARHVWCDYTGESML